MITENPLINAIFDKRLQDILYERSESSFAENKDSVLSGVITCRASVKSNRQPKELKQPKPPKELKQPKPPKPHKQQLTTEEIKQKRKARYLANKDKISKSSKERYLANKDIILAKVTEYQKNNKEKINAKKREGRKLLSLNSHREQIHAKEL